MFIGWQPGGETICRRLNAGSLTKPAGDWLIGRFVEAPKQGRERATLDPPLASQGPATKATIATEVHPSAPAPGVMSHMSQSLCAVGTSDPFKAGSENWFWAMARVRCKRLCHLPAFAEKRLPVACRFGGVTWPNTGALPQGARATTGHDRGTTRNVFGIETMPPSRHVGGRALGADMENLANWSANKT